MGLFGSSSPLPQETRDEINSLAAEFESLRVADSDRLQRFETYRKENESARDVDLTQGVVEDYGRQANTGETFRHRIPLPFGMAITVKHAYRIAGRLPDAIVDRREESAEERYRSDTMEKIWWGTLHASNGESVVADGAWDGSQLGATCFEPYFDPGSQMAKIRTVDPAGVVVVRGIENPHDFQRVYRYWQAPLATVKAEYREAQYGGVPVTLDQLSSTHKVGNQEMVTLVEMKDRQKCVRFVLQSQGEDSVPVYEKVHGLGFVNFIVIPNIGPYRDVWGWADYDFVRGLVAYIPQLFGREADIIRATAAGAVIEKGTGQDAAAVKSVIAKGGVLPSRRDGSVEPIQTPDVPDFEQAHSASAMEFLKMLGFAPDASWGGSDTRSGSDRALQLQPLVEFTAMKQLNWTSGLSRLAAMCFQMIEKQSATSLKATYRGSRPNPIGKPRAFAPFQIGPELDAQRQMVEGEDGDEFEIELPRTPKELFDGDYSIRFVWQNRIDPDDPSYVLSEINKFTAGVQSLRTTLERFGIQAPEDEIKLIEQEAEKYPWLREGMIKLVLAEIAAAAGQQGGTGQPEGAPPNPAGSLQSALGSMVGNGTRATDVDALGSGLGVTGQLYGGA